MTALLCLVFLLVTFCLLFVVCFFFFFFFFLFFVFSQSVAFVFCAWLLGFLFAVFSNLFLFLPLSIIIFFLFSFSSPQFYSSSSFSASDTLVTFYILLYPSFTHITTAAWSVLMVRPDGQVSTPRGPFLFLYIFISIHGYIFLLPYASKVPSSISSFGRT